MTRNELKYRLHVNDEIKAIAEGLRNKNCEFKSAPMTSVVR